MQIPHPTHNDSSTNGKKISVSLPSIVVRAVQSDKSKLVSLPLLKAPQPMVVSNVQALKSKLARLLLPLNASEPMVVSVGQTDKSKLDISFSVKA